MGISLFFMTHGYNAPLLDYDIAAAAGIGDRGARTPRGNGERDNQETPGRPPISPKRLSHTHRIYNNSTRTNTVNLQSA